MDYEKRKTRSRAAHAQRSRTFRQIVRFDLLDDVQVRLDVLAVLQSDPRAHELVGRRLDVTALRSRVKHRRDK